jgi:ankyrin repeat protein
MTGNEQVRFCEHCNLHVTDLSAMTRQQAMRLVARSQGRLCVRYIQTPDGGVLMKQVPEKLYRIGCRVSRLAAGAFTATLSVASATAQSQAEITPRPITPINVTAPLPQGAMEPQGQEKPAEIPRVVMGEMVFRGPNDPLVDAAYKNDVEKVKQLVFAGANPNVIDKPTDMMALSQAVEHGNIDIVRVLLGAGADARAANNDGRTPLMYLGDGATPDLVRELLAAGAEVNAQDKSGATALMNGASDGKYAILKELVEAGAKVDLKDENDKTAWMFAASNSDEAVVRLLIDAGSDVKAKDSDGQTALMIAADEGPAEAVQALINAGAEINERDAEGHTALMLAASSGHAESVLALLQAGADAGTKDKEGLTALGRAHKNSKGEVAKLLQSYGAPE